MDDKEKQLEELRNLREKLKEAIRENINPQNREQAQFLLKRL